MPVEFSSDTTSLNDVILISAPPPPAYDDQFETTESDFPVPAPVLNEEVIAVLLAKDGVPNSHASVLGEPEPVHQMASEPEPVYREKANELVKPTEGNGAAVVTVSGIAAVELKEKVSADSRSGKRSHESTEKHVKVESARGKVTVEHTKTGSDEKFDKGTSGKRAVSLAYAVANEENRKSVNLQPKKTEVTSNRKSYAAPSPPTQQSKITSSPTIAATKVALVTVAAAASIKDEEHQKATSNDNHSDIPEAPALSSKSTVPPAPPPPPPPSIGTLSRSRSPHVTDDNKSPPSSSNGRKILDESRKREESHAALLAAVLKRKNVVDSTDGDTLADSIDARINHTRTQQKIVYRADHTKEVKLPPVAAVGLLAPAEGTFPTASPTKEDDSPGFRAEAEKMRQAFLLKKTVSREASNQPETIQARPEENGSVKASSTNGALTSDSRTVNRPNSTVVKPQPVLADVAAIIAQKALARQKKGEAEPKVDEVKLKTAEADPKLTGAELKVTEASPKISSVAVDDGLKATIANRSVFESGTLKPAVSATLPKNSTSNANVSGPISSVATRSQQPTVTNQQRKVYGASVISSSALQTNNNNPDSTLTLPNTKLGNGKPSNRNSSVYTSSTVAAPMANVPRNRNSSIYPSSPPAAVETTASVMKSSRQVTTLPTGAKANSVKQSMEAPLVIPPPVEFATPTEAAGFSTEVHATATLRSAGKSSNSMVFLAKGSIASDPVPAQTSFRNRSINTWSEDDVAEWLKSFDYSDYHPLFAEKKVTGQVLAQMKPNELEAMGIKNMLHRNRIEREIRSAMARK